MSITQSQNQSTRRRQCCFCGCMVSVALLVLFAGWVVSDFITWRRCTIPLPDGSGSVVYMARLNKILVSEWDRKVCIEIKGIKSREMLMPDDGGGASPINVYWYPVKEGRGPYLRLVDPIFEYLLDIQHGTVLLVVRYQGDVYVGEVRKQYSGYSCRGPIMDEHGKISDPTVSVEVDGRPAHKLESSIASHLGVYIGCIGESYRGFIPKSAAPEVPIKPYEAFP